MAKRGRKNKYETHIKPYLDEITKLLSQGATEEIICEKYGVGKTVFNEYKQKYPELMTAIKTGHTKIVGDVRGALFKRAIGYYYEETKHYEKVGDDGKVTSYTEITKKHQPADVGAAHLLLKNYDRDNWSNDWHTQKLKEEEMELKKKIIESKTWDTI